MVWFFYFIDGMDHIFESSLIIDEYWNNKGGDNYILLNETIIAVLIALTIYSSIFKLIGHLRWPRWKAYGKFVVYILLSGVGVFFIGVFWYIYIFGQPILGFVCHIYWCKKHDLDWKRVDPIKYIESEKAYIKSLEDKKGK